MEYIMQLSTDTINVLKNFGAINDGLLFKKGKVLKRQEDDNEIFLKQFFYKLALHLNYGIFS